MVRATDWVVIVARLVLVGEAADLQRSPFLLAIEHCDIEHCQTPPSLCDAVPHRTGVNRTSRTIPAGHVLLLCPCARQEDGEEREATMWSQNTGNTINLHKHLYWDRRPGQCRALVGLHVDVFTVDQANVRTNDSKRVVLSVRRDLNWTSLAGLGSLPKLQHPPDTAHERALTASTRTS